MATFDASGLDEYMSKLGELGLKLEREVMGEAIYEGAAAAFDAVQSGISSIPVDHGFGTPEKPQRGLSERQKAGLHASLGISHMRNDDGYLNVKIGFAGYNDIKTRRWPNGQPNAMVARALERGTSWLRSFPFVKKSMAAAKDRVTGVMQVIIEQKIDALMRGKE